MTAYPRMFALLEVERARAAFATFTTPGWADSHRSSGGVDATRRRSLTELSRTLPDDLNWLYAVPEEPRDWRAEREISTLIEKGQAPGQDIYFHINTRFRPVVPVSHRSERVLIQIEFIGENKHDMLATEDPPHRVVLDFLRRVQPVHAFVALDWINPGDDLPNDPGSYQFFSEAQNRVFDNTFLGPELTRQIPAHLLEPSSGFSHVERVGEGLWITFAGKGFRVTETDSRGGNLRAPPRRLSTCDRFPANSSAGRADLNPCSIPKFS
ncbi:hypothetical protein [Deinococcus sp.]|uniref:hypothetical protein n=1 Tax=Deinococcus sp. TaxID=47478 RepID=UPI003C7E0932